MKHRRTSADRNVRLLRVGESLRHALADILARGEVDDPVLEATPVTVTEVVASPDLRHAKAYIMPLGGTNEDAVLKALNSRAPALRHLLGRMVRMKYTPALAFFVDNSFAEADRVNRLLSSPRVRADIAGQADGPAEDDR